MEDWENLSYAEMGEVHYGGVEFEADMAIKSGNVNDAQRIKAKVNRLTHACIAGGDRSPEMELLLRKYFQLDTLLFRFVLRHIRSEFELLNPDTE